VLIDWFTIIVQVFNFLLLVFLLKRFLYGPILRVVEEREKKIASTMEEAEKAKEEALGRAEALQAEKEAVGKAREELFARAQKDVQQWRETTLENVRREIESSRSSWVAAREAEQARFYQQVATRVAEQVIAISRKVLADLSSGDLEAQLVETFLGKVQEERDGWNSVAVGSGSEITARTGVELSTDLKGKIEDALASVFTGAKNVQWELDQDMGFGIQLLAGDWKVEWSLGWYMRGLGKEILDSLTPGMWRNA